ECAVLPGDDEEALKDRIQLLEREWYPKVLQMIENGEVEL
ncbi:phosphoribosylglycinamide formyltransferase, partial [Candidatus Peregrinibacteria bacterium]|nr:phosphoribosylglycinamide formyltransferase [Candidatus Peregrinibacteria bacterium]